MPFSEYRGFEPKSPKELRDQFRAVNDVVTGGEKESSLIPPSVKEKDVLKMSEEEIKNTWPYRYEMYLRLVREMKQFRNEESSDEDSQMSEEELSEMKKWLTALNSLDAYITNHKEGNGEITLRDRQFTVFEDIRTFLEHGGTEGYIKLPTGVGKTVLFTELVEALGMKTLIVVPTVILVEQTRNKVEQFATDLDVGKVYGAAKEFDHEVTITTYDSFVSKVNDHSFNPDNYDCLVLDEAHMALSEGRQKVIKKFNRALKIGFSATPNYSAEKKLSNLLPTEIHSMTVREAVEEDGLISPLSSVVVKTQVDLSKVERYKDGKWKESSLAKAVNIAGRNKAAVDIYRNNFNGRFAIAYCVGVKHATKVADTFREAGIPAAHISGKMNKKIQDKILEQYNIGELKVLCNADLLIVGFDEPKTSVCFNLEPTQSAVKAEQRGGRVLRLDQANTNKHAYIIDFLDEGYFDGNGGVRQGPVLFADVVDGVRFAPKNKKKHLGGGGGGGAVQIIDLEGVEVITDEEEIMRLVRKSRDAAKPKEVKFFLPFDEFKSQVRAAGIKNNQEYTRVYKNYTNWPAAPYRIYEEEWPTGGWSEFLLGLEKKKWLTFEKIQEEVRLAGVETRDQYKQVYSQYPGWPSNPNDAYKEVWPGWPKFLGKEILGFLSFTELKIEVIAANVKSSEQYKREYGEHPGWPSNPNLTYSKEWISWPDFFENGYLSFGELKKQVKEMGISSVDHYLKEYKKHPGWPSTPHKQYKGEWLGWVEFLEKNLPFNEFQRQVREQGIVSSLDYKKKYKQYPKWPSMPENLYRNVWPGWPAFLGKK